MIAHSDFEFAIGDHTSRVNFQSPAAIMKFFKHFGADFEAYRAVCAVIREERVPPLLTSGKKITPDLLFNGAFLDGFVIGALAARSESLLGTRN